MKKSRVYILTVVMLVMAMLFLVFADQASAAGTIILVGEAGDTTDDPLEAFIVGLGHTVSRRGDMEDENKGPPNGNGPDMAALNAAELVVISRSAFSGDYDVNAKLWNDVTSPMLQMNSFLLRGNRWGWIVGGIADVDQAVQDITIADAGHPYVAGLGGTQVFDYSDSSYDPKRIENGGVLDKLPRVTKTDGTSSLLAETQLAATLDAGVGVGGTDPMAFAFSIPAGTASALTGDKAGTFGGKRGYLGTDTYVSVPSEDYGLRLTANYQTLLTNAINDLLGGGEFLADFDNDNDVDGADFLVWQRDIGTSADLANWQSEFGSVAAATAAVSAVPEPSTGSLLLVSAGLLVLARKVKRQHRELLGV